MVPTLPPNTLIVAHRLLHHLKAGDIVIFVHEGREKIKRVSDTRAEEVFVLGDHAKASTDSRHFGWISKNQVEAKVFWPR